MSAVRITAKICGQTELAPGICSMWISCGQITEKAVPGQFVILYCKDSARKLGRPISICEMDKKQGKLRIVYRVAGKGTAEFSNWKENEEITILGPLGNGYTEALDFAGESCGHGILVAGGIGIPPMLELAKQLPGKVTAVMGYRDSRMFLKEELEQYAQVLVSTEDGSAGTKGNVLDLLKEKGISGDYICACGPRPMLKSLKEYAEEQNIDAWMSLEEKMACGIGVCLGCAVLVQTEKGALYKRVCKDGPVFHSKEILFYE